MKYKKSNKGIIIVGQNIIKDNYYYEDEDDAEGIPLPNIENSKSLNIVSFSLGFASGVAVSAVIIRFIA